MVSLPSLVHWFSFVTNVSGSAVFQAGGFVVVLVEVMRRNYLASIVPVIVNAVLNEHQVIVDIVAFVAKGDFPRSRLGEKQRGKILASWVTRKMETIAQFSIRDADSADSQITEVAEPRSAVGSVRVGSSLKNVETTPAASSLEPAYSNLPSGVSEMPVPYESSIVESPPLPREDEQDDAPTEARTNRYAADDELYISRAEPEYDDEDYSQHTGQEPQHYDFDDLKTPQNDHDPSAFQLPTSQIPAQPNPRYESKPALSPPTFDNNQNFVQDGDLRTLPSQQRSRQQQLSAYGASGNAGRSRGSSSGTEGGDWPQEAIMHMNLGGGGKGQDRYDGSGYGNAL